MQIFLYTILFIIGIFFGSFFTLAVHRIPKKEDILIKRSYCPNCNHKLGFLDLFPVFSYIFLKGKCRYCNMKIRPRYLILEIISGIIFALVGFSLKINIFSSCKEYIYLIFTLLYISILFIIAGIDKEKVCVDKNIIFVGYVIEIIYIIYLCILGNVNIYQYVIYSFIVIILLIISIISLKVSLKEKYYIQNLYLALYISAFSGGKLFILTTVLMLILISVLERKNKKIPIGYYMVISNVSLIIGLNILKEII